MASGLIAMAANFLNLGTKEGMQKLDKLLGDQSFISGAIPCKDDLVIYGALQSSIDPTHINILKWYNKVDDIIGPRFAREGEGMFINKIIALSPKESNVDEDNSPSSSNEVNKEALNVLHEEVEVQSVNLLEKPTLNDLEVRILSIKLHIKPWNKEDNLTEMENHVRGVQMDGLTWDESKVVVVEDGKKVLEIMMMVESDKVSPLDLIEKIIGDETTDNHVQSCDIVSFNKL